MRYLIIVFCLLSLTSYSQVNLRVKGVMPLPSQTGNSGRYLTTNGSAASWGNITLISDTSRIVTTDKTQSIVGRKTFNSLIFFNKDSVTTTTGNIWGVVIDTATNQIQRQILNRGSGANGQVVYWNGTNTQAGNNNLFWDNTNSRLGVGTSTPSTTLQVVGGTQINTSFGTTPLRLYTGNQNDNGLNVGDRIFLRAGFSNEAEFYANDRISFYSTSATAGYINMYSPRGIYIRTTGTTDSDLRFGAANTETIRIWQTSRNVSIQNGGTFTDAGFRLDVNGTARIQNRLTLGGQTIYNKDSVTRTTGKQWYAVIDTVTGQLQRQQVNEYDFITESRKGSKFYHDWWTLPSEAMQSNSSGSGTSINGGFDGANDSYTFNLGTAATASTGYEANNSGNGAGLSAWRLSTDTTISEWRISIDSLSKSTDRFYFHLGWVNSFGAIDPFNGVYFLYDEGGVSSGSSATPNWQFVTTASGSRTFTNTGVAVTAGSFVKLTIKAVTGRVLAFINDVQVANHTTNIPSAGYTANRWGFNIRRGATVIATKSATIDYCLMFRKLATPR